MSQKDREDAIRRIRAARLVLAERGMTYEVVDFGPMTVPQLVAHANELDSRLHTVRRSA